MSTDELNAFEFMIATPWPSRMLLSSFSFSWFHQIRAIKNHRYYHIIVFLFVTYQQFCFSMLMLGVQLGDLLSSTVSPAEKLHQMLWYLLYEQIFGNLLLILMLYVPGWRYSKKCDSGIPVRLSIDCEVVFCEGDAKELASVCEIESGCSLTFALLRRRLVEFQVHEMVYSR